MVSTVFLLGLLVVIGLVIVLGFFSWFSWKIPCVILQYHGDKRRPQLKFTKARRMYANGVWRLQVRGYKLPIRDFKTDYYYPSSRGKHGALLLWEYKHGYLTPTVPTLSHLKKKDRKHIEKVLDEARKLVEGLDVQGVDFEHNVELYKSLHIQAVDDTDIDWMLQEIARVNNQYTVGWRDWFTQNKDVVVMLFFGMLILVGFILWLERSPDLAAQCASWGTEQANNVLRNLAEEGIVRAPAGGPPA